MNNLEETDGKDLILRRKGEARNFRGTQEKITKRNLLERYKKIQFSLKMYRYLEWTEGRDKMAKNVHQLKEKLNNNCIQQLGKYTHTFLLK